MGKVRNMLGNLMSTDDAEKMIVVFPYIYTSKEQENCSGLDLQNSLNYDNFINDLTTDLMPYINSNFSVKTGRENTAITGFSMGGRESLFIGLTQMCIRDRPRLVNCWIFGLIKSEINLTIIFMNTKI